MFVRPDPNTPTKAYGTDGALTCTGVVVTMPDGTIAIFHFQPGEDGASTLSKYQFPAGSVFVVFGGTNDDSSINTLTGVLLYVGALQRNHGMTFYTLPFAQSVWVDKDGNWKWQDDPQKH